MDSSARRRLDRMQLNSAFGASSHGDAESADNSHQVIDDVALNDDDSVVQKTQSLKTARSSRKTKNEERKASDGQSENYSDNQFDNVDVVDHGEDARKSLTRQTGALMEVAAADLEIDELVDGSEIEEEYDEEKLGIKEDIGGSNTEDEVDSIDDILEKMSREREAIKSKSSDLRKETQALKEATKQRRNKLAQSKSGSEVNSRTPSERPAASPSPATKEKMRRPDDRARAESRKRSSRAATNQQFVELSGEPDLVEAATVSPKVLSLEDKSETKTVVASNRDAAGIQKDTELVKRVDLDATVKGLGASADISEHVREFLIGNETPESKVTVKEYGQTGVSVNQKKPKMIASQPKTAGIRKKSVKPALPPEATAPAREQAKKKQPVVVDQPVLIRHQRMLLKQKQQMANKSRSGPRKGSTESENPRDKNFRGSLMNVKNDHTERPLRQSTGPEQEDGGSGMRSEHPRIDNFFDHRVHFNHKAGTLTPNEIAYLQYAQQSNAADALRRHGSKQSLLASYNVQAPPAGLKSGILRGVLSQTNTPQVVRGAKRGLRSAQGARNAHAATMRTSFKSLYRQKGLGASHAGPFQQTTADAYRDWQPRQGEHHDFAVDNIGVQDVSDVDARGNLRRVGSAQSTSDPDFNLSQGNISSAQISGVGFPRKLTANQSETMLRNHNRMNTILGCTGSQMNTRHSGRYNDAQAWFEGRSASHGRAGKRLKSANIYSQVILDQGQRIKMYNPSMLIFTPNNNVAESMHSGKIHVSSATQTPMNAQTYKRADRSPSELEQAAKDGRLSPVSLAKIGHFRVNATSATGGAGAAAKKRNAVSSSAKDVSKEDIAEQLLLVKLEVNELSSQNTKLRTQNSKQHARLREKERFIDELIKSTYALSRAPVTSGVDQLRAALHYRSKANKRRAGSPVRDDSQSPKNNSPIKIVEEQQSMARDFMEKGPFNVLRMNKQLADMRDLLQQRQEMIDDLKRNIKATRMTEVQEELKQYQKECLRLRFISELAISILLQNGLGDVLRKNKRLKNFLRTINWSQFEMQNVIQDLHQIDGLKKHIVRSLEQLNSPIGSPDSALSPKQEATAAQLNEVSQVFEASERVQHLAQVCQNLQMQLNQSNELNQERQEQLESNAQLFLRLKEDREMTQVAMRRVEQQCLAQQDELTQARKEVQHYKRQLMNDTNDSSAELVAIQQRYEISEQHLAKSNEQIERLKLQLEELSEKVKKSEVVVAANDDVKLTAAPVAPVDSKSDQAIEQLQQLKEELAAAKKQAEDAIAEAAKHQEHIVSLTGVRDDLKSEVDRLQRELEQAQKSASEAPAATSNEDAERKKKENDLRIDAEMASRQLAIAEAERDRYKALLDEERIAADKLRIDRQHEQNQVIDLNKKYIDLQDVYGKLQIENNAKALELDELRRKLINLESTIKKQPGSSSDENKLRVETPQRRGDGIGALLSPGVGSGHRIAEADDSGQLGSSFEQQLEQQRILEEMEVLRQRLQETSFANMEDRSDIISSVSYLLQKQRTNLFQQEGRRSVSSKSPTKIERMRTNKSLSQKKVEIIEEDAELEFEKMDASNAVELQQQIEKTKQREKFNNDKRAMMSQIGKSKSNINAKSFFNVQDSLKKQNTGVRLMDAIDNVPDTSSIFTEDLSHFEAQSKLGDLIAQPAFKQTHQTTFIAADDPAVKLGMNRIGMLQLLLRIPTDKVDSILFDKPLPTYKSLRLCELAHIFMQKLGLNTNEATRFARYLVEEREDRSEIPGMPSQPQSPEVELIQYDPNRRVNSSYLSVRIMYNTAVHVVFQECHEEEARAVFTAAFKNKYNKLKQLLQTQAANADLNLIHFSLFKGLVGQLVGKEALAEEQLQCIYILLCRDGHTAEELRQMRSSELHKKVRGFEVDSVDLLFAEEAAAEAARVGASPQAKVDAKSARTEANKTANAQIGGFSQIKSSDGTSDYHSKQQANPVTPVLGGEPARQSALASQGFTSAVDHRASDDEEGTADLAGAARRQTYHQMGKGLSFADQTLKARRATGSIDSQKLKDTSDDRASGPSPSFLQGSSSNQPMPAVNEELHVSKISLSEDREDISVDLTEAERRQRGSYGKQISMPSQSPAAIDDLAAGSPDNQYSSRDETDFDMQESLTREGATLLKERLMKQVSIKSQMPPGYDKEDIQFIRQQVHGSVVDERDAPMRGPDSSKQPSLRERTTPGISAAEGATGSMSSTSPFHAAFAFESKRTQKETENTEGPNRLQGLIQEGQTVTILDQAVNKTITEEESKERNDSNENKSKPEEVKNALQQQIFDNLQKKVVEDFKYHRMITFNQRANDDEDYYVGVSRAKGGEDGAVLRKSTNTGDSFKSSQSLGDTAEGAEGSGTPQVGHIRVTNLAVDKLQDAANISLDQPSSSKRSGATESQRRKIGSHRSGQESKDFIQIQGDNVEALGSIAENVKEGSESATPLEVYGSSSAELRAEDVTSRQDTVPVTTEKKLEESIQLEAKGSQNIETVLQSQETNKLDTSSGQPNESQTSMTERPARINNIADLNDHGGDNFVQHPLSPQNKSAPAVQTMRAQGAEPAEVIDQASFDLRLLNSGTFKSLADTRSDEEAQAESFVVEAQQIVFDEESLSLARQALQHLLENKIDSSLQSSLNQDSLQRVIDKSLEIFQVIAIRLIGAGGPDQFLTFRELMHHRIHSFKEKVETADGVIHYEVELVKSQDFFERLDDLLSMGQSEGEAAQALDVTQIQCLQTIFQSQRYVDMIEVDEVCLVLEALKVSEMKPQNVQGIDYGHLDLKSVRIFNRMLMFFAEERKQKGDDESVIDFNKFMADIVTKQAVKTKQATPEVELFQAAHFFDKLQQYGIRKSAEIHWPICRLLCIDAKYESFLMLKKLRKVLLCIKSNRFARQVGTRSRRVTLQDMPQTPHKDSSDRTFNGALMTSKEPKVYATSQASESIDGPTIREVQQRSTGDVRCSGGTEDVSDYQAKTSESPDGHPAHPNIAVPMLLAQANWNHSSGVSRQASSEAGGAGTRNTGNLSLGATPPGNSPGQKLVYAVNFNAHQRGDFAEAEHDSVRHHRQQSVMIEKAFLEDRANDESQENR